MPSLRILEVDVDGKLVAQRHAAVVATATKRDGNFTSQYTSRHTYSNLHTHFLSWRYARTLTATPHHHN